MNLKDNAMYVPFRAQDVFSAGLLHEWLNTLLLKWTAYDLSNLAVWNTVLATFPYGRPGVI